jgi:hypothetical protein
MRPDRVEETTEVPQVHPVQLQPGDRGPPHVGAAEDLGGIRAPGAVVAPTVTARVIEGNDLARRGIAGVGRGVLAAVAPCAGIGQIRDPVAASTRLWLDVIDGERIRGVTVRRAAILTEPASTIRYALTFGPNMARSPWYGCCSALTTAAAWGSRGLRRPEEVALPPQHLDVRRS